MKKIYVKEEVCIGCHLCEVYCRFQHSASTYLVKAFKRYPDPPVSRTNVAESGVISLSLRCQHCDESPCLFACLTGALSRNPLSGVIEVDSDKCIGCWTCMLACPFEALKQDIDKRSVVKCDLCQGEDLPACVANCPNEALLYTEAIEEKND